MSGIECMELDPISKKKNVHLVIVVSDASEV